MNSKSRDSKIVSLVQLLLVKKALFISFLSFY